MRLAGSYVIPVLLKRGYIKSFETQGGKKPGAKLKRDPEHDQPVENIDLEVTEQGNITETKRTNKAVSRSSDTAQ